MSDEIGSIIDRVLGKFRESPTHSTAIAETEQERREKRRERLRLADVQGPKMLAHAVAAADAAKWKAGKGSPRYRAADSTPDEQAKAAASTQVYLVTHDLITGSLRSLAICGPKGIGKTWALAVACAELDGSLWIETPTIAPSQSWDQVKRRAIGCGFLAFSDLTTRTKPWQAAEIADLICTRHDRELRSALATNLTREQLRAALGSDTMDRLRCVEIRGPSLREEET